MVFYSSLWFSGDFSPLRGLLDNKCAVMTALALSVLSSQRIYYPAVHLLPNWWFVRYGWSGWPDVFFMSCLGDWVGDSGYGSGAWVALPGRKSRRR